MYLILGVLASDVVIFRFNPSSDNLYVPLSSPEIILYFIVLLWVADKEMTTVYPPSEIDKRQTSPNANVTKVTTVSVDIFMFFDTDFMFGIGRSSPSSRFWVRIMSNYQTCKFTPWCSSIVVIRSNINKFVSMWNINLSFKNTSV